MLSPDKIASRDANEWGSDTGSDASGDLEKLIAMARRQWRVVAVSVVATLIVAFGYILTAVPLYTANTLSLIHI